MFKMIANAPQTAVERALSPAVREYGVSIVRSSLVVTAGLAGGGNACAQTRVFTGTDRVRTHKSGPRTWSPPL